MKKDIHPKNYRTVLFKDASSSAEWLIESTVDTKKEVGISQIDKKEYPLFRIEISSQSHPFYTGKETVLDTAGRVDKFKKRQAQSSKK